MTKEAAWEWWVASWRAAHYWDGTGETGELHHAWNIPTDPNLDVRLWRLFEVEWRNYVRARSE